MDETQKRLADELTKRAVTFADTISKQNEELKATHIKKEFTFSTVEKRRLLQQESATLIAHQAIEDIINLTVLARVNITPNPSIRVLYDSSLGKFCVWSSKEEVKPLEESPEPPAPQTEPV